MNTLDNPSPEQRPHLFSCDWSRTELGAISAWPQCLRFTVELIMNFRSPALIFWGTGQIVIDNDACHSLLGTIFECGHSAARVAEPRLQRAIHEAYRGTPTTLSRMNLLLRRPDGRMREACLTWSLSPIRLDDGSVGGVCALLEEETRIVASERQLSTLIGNVPGMVYRCRNDRDWTMLFVSDGIKDLTGYSADDLVRGQIRYGNLIHPDDAPVVWREVQESLRKSRKFTLEYRIFTRDGVLKWVWEQGIGVDTPAGEFYAIEGLILDITERKLAHEALEESESRFKRLANAMPQLVWVADGEGKIIYVNDRWMSFAGEGIYGHSWENRIHPDDRKKTWDELQRAAETKTTFTIEYRLRDRDERYQWFLGRATPTLDASGRIVQWFGTCTNIEEQKEAEAELRMAKEAADHANLAKSQFLTNMSHEIRTPMNSILGFSDLLAEASLSDEYREYVQRIKTNGRHLLQIIDDILDISKVESGKVQLEYTQFSPANLISDVFQSLRGLAQNKGIEAKFIIEPGVPELITSDPLRVRQILMNLANNALKFTERGQILIRYRESDSRPDSICIEVEDTGIGIAPERTRSLFRLFEQADSSITRRFGGTGLGLVLSRRLAEILGGSLRLKWTEQDKGSCFEIQLPVQGAGAPTQPSDDKESASRMVSADQEVSLEGLRVLVAEDSTDNIMLLRIFLEKEGVELGVVNNGAEAVEAVRSNDFDLILMDIQMPVMDGLEATRRLRSDGFDKPIIALTAHALKEEIDKSLAAGCDAHLSKPVSRGDLASTLRAYVRKANER